jgi:hypothetical protein
MAGLPGRIAIVASGRAAAARVTDRVAAITTASEVRLDEAGCGDWLRAGRIQWSDGGGQRVMVTDRRTAPDVAELALHPPVLALGIGCTRDTAGAEIADLANATLSESGLSPAAVAVVASAEAKLAEAGIHALARHFGVPVRFFPAARLLDETERLTERSAAAFRATGCWGVAEGAALAAAGRGGSLVVVKRKSRRATCAVARATGPIYPRAIGCYLGRAGGTKQVLPLSELAEAAVDASSIVIVGGRNTRRLDLDVPRLYTPRGYRDLDRTGVDPASSPHCGDETKIGSRATRPAAATASQSVLPPIRP